MRLTYFVQRFKLQYSIHTKCIISAPHPILFAWESYSRSGHVKLEIQVMERM